MANRPSRLQMSIPLASHDGRFYGRYPQGNAPLGAIAGNAASISTATGALTTGSGGGSDATDWAQRISGPGVVWANNFASQGEVDSFRAHGGGFDSNPANSPALTYNSTDGFGGGGSIYLTIPTGGNINGQVWWRPMSPIAAGNGYPLSDPGANGAITPQSWNGSVSSEGYQWRKGYYANRAIQNQYGVVTNGINQGYWPTTATPGAYDGEDYWFSVRVKIQGTRWGASGTNPSGKLMYLDLVGSSGAQEILIESNAGNQSADSLPGGGHELFYQTQPFLMYTSFGNYANSVLTSDQGSYAGTPEPGSQWATTCLYGVGTGTGMDTPNSCWFFPKDTWFTLLFHVMPGQDNNTYTTGLNTYTHFDQSIEVWKNEIGDGPVWTPVYRHQRLAFNMDGSGPQSGQNGPTGNWQAPGYNGISLSCYMNSDGSNPGNAVVGWYQAYTQAILSKNWIPPPGLTAPGWWANDTTFPPGTWTVIANTAGTRLEDAFPTNPPSVPGGSHIAQDLISDWTGASVIQETGEYTLVANGGHSSYPGNEAYVLNLRAATPTWVRCLDPTPSNVIANQDINTPNAFTFPDGRVKAMHSCNQIYANGRTWFPMCNSLTNGQGASDSQIVSFNWNWTSSNGTSLQQSKVPVAQGGPGPIPYLAADNLNGSTNLSPYPYVSYPFQSGPWECWSNGGSDLAMQFGSSCFDPVTGDIWQFGGKGGASPTGIQICTKGAGLTTTLTDPSVPLSQNSGTLPAGTPGSWKQWFWGTPSGHSSVGNFLSWSAIAHDLRIAVVADGQNGFPVVLDLTNPGNGFTAITNMSGPTSSASSGVVGPVYPGFYGGFQGGSGGCAYAGAVYYENDQCIYVGGPHDIGRAIWKLKIPTQILNGHRVYNPSGTWVWTQYASPAGTGPDSVTALQTYTQWNIVRNMGDGRSAIVLAADVDKVYVFKLPFTGMP